MRGALRGELKNALLMAAGLVVAAVGYRMYLIPNRVVAGGFTGVGQLLNHLLGINVGTVNLALNIPLFALSMRHMGIRFGLRSLIGMTALSLLIDHMPLPPATDDILLASVYGGAISGIGFGLVLRGNATTGGTDMLASLLHRAIPVLKVSYAIFFFDGLVIIASAFTFEPQAAMYGLIGAFLCNVMTDLVLEGPNSAHSYFIISEKSEAIARKILGEMDRGVTGLEAVGMYSGTHKQVLLCVVNRFEAMRLRQIIFQVDPRAFVIANKAHEVLGEGFSPASNPAPPATREKAPRP
ncbi:MAG: YitT family protein [Clostridia bacterium]|nr:YitT family protein [Clostridia bacterium]